MAGVLQHLRSSTLDKRPNPASMVDGQVAINYASGSPGMFFKDSNGSLVKVGPVHVGSGAPNAVPASGGTAGNSLGEQWLDTSGGTYVFKIWDGAAWRSEAGEFVNVTGDTMTGALGIIAGSAGSPSLFISGDANTGLYSPGADQVAISTNGTQRLLIEADGDINIDSGGVFYDATNNRLAIGTTEPRFSVSIGSTAGAGVVNPDTLDLGGTYSSVAGANAKLRVYWDGTDTFGFGVSPGQLEYTVPSSSSHVFYRGTTQSAKIDSSGRLLVGTSSASGTNTLLESSSTAANSANVALVKRNSGTADQAGQQLHFYNFGPSGTARAAGTEVGNIRFYGSQPTSGAAQEMASIQCAADVIQTGANTSGRLVFSTTADGASSPTERMRITSAGNVGIGTTSPSVNLHIVGGGPGVDATARIGSNQNGAFLQIGPEGSNTIRNFQIGSVVGDGFNFYDITASTERARIDSSGRLLVGTSSSPSSGNGQYAKLAVQGSTASSTDPAIFNLQSGKAATSLVSSDDIGFIQFTDNAGNVFAWIRGIVDGTPGAGDYPGRLVFSTTADGASGPTERMRIGQSGTVTINGPGGGSFLVLSNSGGYSGRHELDNTAYTIGQNSDLRALRIGSGANWLTTGVNLAAGGTSWGTYSDERLKEDIVELNGCLEQLSGIRCVTYRLRNIDDADSKKRLGVIAQDLEGKFDEALNASRRSEDDENEYLSVQYADLVPVLIKSLQEAKGRIETLEAKVAALEGV
jgi:hypothetical protein